MKLFQAYCNAAYYNEFDSPSLLSDIQSYINPSISELNKEFQFIFYKMLHAEPCSYWDKTVYDQAITQLENLFQNHEALLEIDEYTFNYFLI